jgi:uncharacterized protein (TIGR03083 family)
MIMGDAELQPVVAEALGALADGLEDLSPDRVDTPSLCQGWTVRNVLAHMTMAARYSPEEFTAQLRSDGFDFTRLSNRLAEQDGGLPFHVLVKDLRTDAMAHWAPPGGGFEGALTHAVIHGLDITVPLGLPRSCDEEAMRLVLDGLTTGGVHRHFGVEVDGLHLRATDLDWSFGSGTRVEAPAHEIALMLCGREL